MTLTQQDSSFLKGMAIMMIVLHNFCHWLPTAVMENEYTFQVDRIWKYVGYLENGGPHLFLNFLSHFGHYGVPLFLFLSGYGLVKKYEKSGAGHVGVGRFMWSHAVKMWKLLVPAILLFMACEFVLRGGWNIEWKWVGFMLTYVSNFIPKSHLLMGPWWFFSLIMQFYLLYRCIFLPFRSSWVLWSITGASLLLQMVLMANDTSFVYDDKTVSAMEYLRYNAVGHLVSFALGIEMARRDWNYSPLWMFIAGTVLTIASAFNAWLWFFSPIFAVMALVPLAQLIRASFVRQVFEWIGPISAAIFAFHPIVRRYLILPTSRAMRMNEPTLIYGEILLYLLLTLLLAWGYTQMMSRLKRKTNSNL